MLEIKEKIENLVSEKNIEIKLEFSDKCDFTSTIAFKLSKELKKSPKEIAEEKAKLIKEILANNKEINGYVEVKAVNGYINFYLTDKYYQEKFKDLFNKKFFEKKREKIVLEHTSVNPSGAIHVGRMRNALIGDAISRILKYVGYDVETHYYVNDMGKQIAMIAIAKNKNIKKILEKYKNNKRSDYETLFYYIAGNEKYREDKDFSNEVDELIRKAESNDEKALNLMKQTAKFCLEGQKETLKLLNIHFHSYDYESDFIKEAKKVINFLGREINLEEYGIKREKGNIVLAREDGTSVYLARDIAYHLYKIKLGDIIINVLGEDHKQEALELKTILEKKYNVKKQLKNIFFSFVNFQGERFSTRAGNIITVDELIEKAIKKAKEIMISKNFATEGYEKVGIGAIKYYILKIDPLKQINFNLEDALNFDGDTSCYIQYVYARCCRIIEKSKETEIKKEESKDKKFYSFQDVNEDEKNLIKYLFKFYFYVEESARQLKPNIIANYLYNLANLFNKFYNSCPVLESKEDIKRRRLQIVFITKQYLQLGLSLLGIETIEKM